MNTKCLSVMMLSMAALIWASAAVAEQISGIVSSVDPSSNRLCLERNLPVTGTLEKLDIAIEPNTMFKGIRSFEELKNGDEVQVFVSISQTGYWRAKRVKVMNDK